MLRSYYSAPINIFLETPSDAILGNIEKQNEFTLLQTQRDAWIEEIKILKETLRPFQGVIYFEYSIPRMGKRVDVLLIIGSVIFVLEFKIGESEFPSYAIDQVWDYALDLKNFHETSHDQIIAPVLISTRAAVEFLSISVTPEFDKTILPIRSNVKSFPEVIKAVLSFSDGVAIDSSSWEKGRYCPTPTIIEAAMALYNGHSVTEISRNDASAINLTKTSDAVTQIIRFSKENSQKSICFVTGVPGAGKTLVGLNIATTHFDQSNALYSVFLSGNGPLVAILREALARDRVFRVRDSLAKLRIGQARSEVKAFIQNIHHFRDECLIDPFKPPIEHVTLFDEAQRAWNIKQTSKFMRVKKGIAGFNKSEPDFLISCLDRHSDWAVIICLVGGGQEINTGEAGISEWIEALERSYPDWHVYISERMNDSEYNASEILKSLNNRLNVVYKEELHLAISMRSFRAENVSLLVKTILDVNFEESVLLRKQLSPNYPIVVTRNLISGKKWLKKQARGTERYGIVVSSQAIRLKPYAIDIKSPMDPIHWFLDEKQDVRSSYYLEDVATEFHIQGLELDWVCVVWDADFRYSRNGWEHWSFIGDKWTHIKKATRKQYLKNAYRVLLTRARQGMVIVVPEGDPEDPTRNPSFYNSTFEYLKEMGFNII
ncbi:MAG: DUF2075 domain-containing protein [Bacteroidetes bacterium]|nr:MAG: DUF2075 domain-containing protein [Bacteroidota bacterium]